MSTPRRAAGSRGVTRIPVGHGPGIGTLADLPDLLGGESERSRQLLGGLVAGAFVGAAVAGYVLHARQGRDRRRTS